MSIKRIEVVENPEAPSAEEFAAWKNGSVGTWWFTWLTEYFHMLAENTIREGNINYDSVEETALKSVRSAVKSNTVFEIANADVEYIKGFYGDEEVDEDDEEV
tara:strand:+ start:177 stop:485 length:309 start_codon:yes stop_codon:yes gene_type:complete